jgi:hypothetical protein
MIADNTGDEATILLERIEVAVSAQLDRLFEATLQVSIAALDGTVLMATPRLLRVATMP